MKAHAPSICSRQTSATPSVTCVDSSFVGGWSSSSISVELCGSIQSGLVLCALWRRRSLSWSRALKGTSSKERVGRKLRTKWLNQSLANWKAWWGLLVFFVEKLKQHILNGLLSAPAATSKSRTKRIMVGNEAVWDGARVIWKAWIFYIYPLRSGFSLVRECTEKDARFTIASQIHFEYCLLRYAVLLPLCSRGDGRKKIRKNSGSKVCSTWKFFTVSLSFFVYRLPQFDCRSTPKQHRRRMSLCLGKWSPLTETRRVRMLLTPQVKS